jgi:alkaline phosphatase D
MSSLKLDNGKMVYDITISSLTAGTGSSRNEVNSRRMEGTLAVEHNFGILSFSGPLKERKLEIESFDKDGKSIWKRTLTRK